MALTYQYNLYCGAPTKGRSSRLGGGEVRGCLDTALRPHIAFEIIQKTVQTYQHPTIQKIHTLAYQQIFHARTLKYDGLF